MTQVWAAPFFQNATLLINESKSPKSRLGRSRCEDFMSTQRSPSDCFSSEFWPPNMGLRRHPTLGKSQRRATHCAKSRTPLIFWDDGYNFGAKPPSSASKREGFFRNLEWHPCRFAVSSRKDYSLLIWGRCALHSNPCLLPLLRFRIAPSVMAIGNTYRTAQRGMHWAIQNEAVSPR